MQIIEAVNDADVLDASGKPAYALHAAGHYLLYDCEVAKGLRSEALRLVAGIDRRLPQYRGEPLENQRLVLPFIGRLGDAVAVASCSAALRERYPRATVDVVCLPSARGVFELLPVTGRLLSYPLEASRLGEYDYYLDLEEIEAVPDGAKRSCADVFSTCLHTPRPGHPPRVTIPDDVCHRWAMPPAVGPRIALHAGLAGSLRTYPADLLRELAAEFVKRGCEVYLIGASGSSPLGGDSRSPYLYDLTGKTATAADLAAVLAQVHRVVAGDSFPMHLAGALGTATIAFFTSTDAVLGSDYPSVTAIQSAQSCSPCRRATGSCPEGEWECTAHRDPSLGPQRLAESVCVILKAATAPVHGSSRGRSCALDIPTRVLSPT
jgi:ADP-heptose:LPS heptosyltransferase